MITYISDNTFSLILPPMISVRQYHRPRYYITEKIFLHPTFDGSHRRQKSPFFVSHLASRSPGTCEKGTREDDPRPCDRRGKTLFSQATINTLPNVRTRGPGPNTPLPSSQCPLTHLWNSRCHILSAMHPIITTLYELHGPRRGPSQVEATGTRNFQGSFQDRRSISGRKSLENENWDCKNHDCHHIIWKTL